MKYSIEPRPDGRWAVNALRPVEIAVLADAELAEILVQALERRSGPCRPADATPAEAAPDAASVAASVAASLAPRPAPEDAAPRIDWDAACERIANGEPLSAVADDLDAPMFTLRGKYGAWQRRRKAEGADAPPSDEQVECATCGRPFAPSPDSGGLCARCRRA